MAQWRAVVDLAPNLTAPAAARQVIAALLQGWGLADGIADAQQVVTELVTNAIRHAPGQASYELEVVGHTDGVRIYVADASPARPIVRHAAAHVEHGRGIRIVRAVAANWGTDEHRGGKRVWADILVARAQQEGRVLPVRAHPAMTDGRGSGREQAPREADRQAKSNTPKFGGRGEH